MKLIFLCSLTILGCALALVAPTLAGPGSAAGGGAQLAPVEDNVAAVPAKVTPPDAAPGANAFTSAGGSSGSQTASNSSGQSASNAGNSSANSVGATGSSGQPDRGNPFTGGVAPQNNVDVAAKPGRGERMEVVPDEKAAKTEPAQKSEVTKKFESSLLDSGLPQRSRENVEQKSAAIEQADLEKGKKRVNRDR